MTPVRSAEEKLRAIFMDLILQSLRLEHYESILLVQNINKYHFVKLFAQTKLGLLPGSFSWSFAFLAKPLPPLPCYMLSIQKVSEDGGEMYTVYGKPTLLCKCYVLVISYVILTA